MTEECSSEEQKGRLLECLAELEHLQWCAWAKTLMEKEDLSEDRVRRWRNLLVAYDDLSDKDKEQDRIWVRKIFKMFNELGIILVSREQLEKTLVNQNVVRSDDLFCFIKDLLDVRSL